MKRVLATLGGLVAGLLVTWLCLFALSHIESPSGNSGTGCGDAEHCDGRWWIGPANLALLVLPAFAFAIVGYLCVASAWSARKTTAVFTLLTLGTGLAGLALFMG